MHIVSVKNSVSTTKRFFENTFKSKTPQYLFLFNKSPDILYQHSKHGYKAKL